jgi:hypothetical protein
MKLSRRTLIVGLSATAVAITLSLWPITTSFDVTAQTDKVRLITDPQYRGTWSFEKVHLARGFAKDDTVFTGRVRIQPKVEVHIVRSGKGPLRILCRSRTPGGVVAELYGADDEHEETVTDRLVLRIDDVAARADAGRAILLTVSGNFHLGGHVTHDSGEGELFREGKITMLGHSLFGRALYNAGSTALDLGDEISIPTSEPSFGIVLADSPPSLGVVMRAVGHRMTVSRFGGRGYDVYAPVAARIKADPTLQIAWATAAALIGFFGLTRRDEKGSEK